MLGVRPGQRSDIGGGVVAAGGPPFLGRLLVQSVSRSVIQGRYVRRLPSLGRGLHDVIVALVFTWSGISELHSGIETLRQ